LKGVEKGVENEIWSRSSWWYLWWL